MLITASKMKCYRQSALPFPQIETEHLLLIIEENHSSYIGFIYFVFIYFAHLKNKTLTCTLHISLNIAAKYFVLIESSLCISLPWLNNWTEKGLGMRMRMTTLVSAGLWGQMIQETSVWPKTSVTSWDKKLSRQILLPHY